MSTQPKTDNDHFGSKLALRRHFLRHYHTGDDGQPAVVFDACQATGQLWSTLRAEFVVKYWGVDRTPMRGRLKIDSARVLEQPGWRFTVVDIDTYGSPFAHWLAVLKEARHPVTVFLTIGSAGIAGAADGALKELLGLGRLAKRVPVGMGNKLTDIGVAYCLAMSYTYGHHVIECREAPRGKTARYIGIRLVPQETRSAGPVASRVDDDRS
jgi:hypothetical protein